MSFKTTVLTKKTKTAIRIFNSNKKSSLRFTSNILYLVDFNVVLKRSRSDFSFFRMLGFKRIIIKINGFVKFEEA
jgi:hypothetical protein